MWQTARACSSSNLALVYDKISELTNRTPAFEDEDDDEDEYDYEANAKP